jgi:hypothetical protein
MQLHPNEEATFRAFVIPAKLDRILTLFGNPKRRKSALDTLNHFSSWRDRCIEEIPHSASAQKVVQLLIAAGALGACYIISDNQDLDRRELPLAEAIAAAEGAQFASVISCNPGKLACYYDEMFAPRIRTMLQKR